MKRNMHFKLAMRMYANFVLTTVGDTAASYRQLLVDEVSNSAFINTLTSHCACIRRTNPDDLTTAKFAVRLMQSRVLYFMRVFTPAFDESRFSFRTVG